MQDSGVDQHSNECVHIQVQRKTTNPDTAVLHTFMQSAAKHTAKLCISSLAALLTTCTPSPCYHLPASYNCLLWKIHNRAQALSEALLVSEATTQYLCSEFQLYADGMSQRHCLNRRALAAGKCPASFSLRRPTPFTASRISCAAQNGNGHHKPACPAPAETARTIVDIVREGTLSTVGPDGIPLGTPVSFTISKQGQPLVSLDKDSIESHNLQHNSKCSLMIQPQTYPARAVASVTLTGQLQEDGSFAVEKCLYFGGLDQTARVQEVSAADYHAAEPDVLRAAATELVQLWNSERAEDIYRVVSHYLHVPLTEMNYAELLWVDRLGMYVRSEVNGKEAQIVRVPFYRPVLDERDLRSVVTMSAQIAWESERNYTPPLPAIFADVANAAAAANN